MAKYYWLRLHRDFFKRHDIRIIEEMQNGKQYVLFLVKLMCESVDHEGCLRFNDAIPYDAHMLATITNTDIDIVRSACKAFGELGLMEVMDDETLYVGIVSSMIGSQSESTERTRLWRERKELASHVTTGDVTSISLYSSSVSPKKKTKREMAKHEGTGLPMNQNRYDRLLKEWGAGIIERYAKKVSAWADDKGKTIRDLAATIEGWLTRDFEAGKIKKPVATQEVDDEIMELVRRGNS